jgi:hypothetical protein
MIPAFRERYNQEFTEEKYKAYLNGLDQLYPGHLEFRIAETPVFVPKDFMQKILDACESIVDVVTQPEYLKQSEKAIPEHLRVPNEDSHPHCIAFDFGVCENESGELEPQLIEMQGFPSLFAWQVLLPETHHQHFWWPNHFDVYLNGYTRETYIDLLKKVIIANHPVENVVLLEIFPHHQKTRVDFYATETLLGIKTVCLTELIQEGKSFFIIMKERKPRLKGSTTVLFSTTFFNSQKKFRKKGRYFSRNSMLNGCRIPTGSIA